MESKSESKSDYRDSKGSKDVKSDEDEEVFYSDYKDGGEGKEEDIDIPQINILRIEISPKGAVPISSGLDLKITFELDRDVVAAFWSVKYLVDSSHSRLIKVLGETDVEDYVDGESDVRFHTDTIDVAGIEPSTLTNSGLLMATFMANGKEVASVNMVSRFWTNYTRIVHDMAYFCRSCRCHKAAVKFCARS